MFEPLPQSSLAPSGIPEGLPFKEPPPQTLTFKNPSTLEFLKPVEPVIVTATEAAVVTEALVLSLATVAIATLDLIFPQSTVSEEDEQRSLNNALANQPDSKPIQEAVYPFRGGQSTVAYNVNYKYKLRISSDPNSENWNVIVDQFGSGTFEGKIVGFGSLDPTNPSGFYGLLYNSGTQQTNIRTNSMVTLPPSAGQAFDWTITSIARADGQPDTGGDPPPTQVGINPAQYPSITTAVKKKDSVEVLADPDLEKLYPGIGVPDLPAEPPPPLFPITPYIDEPPTEPGEPAFPDEDNPPLQDKPVPPLVPIPVPLTSPNLTPPPPLIPVDTKLLEPDKDKGLKPTPDTPIRIPIKQKGEPTLCELMCSCECQDESEQANRYVLVTLTSYDANARITFDKAGGQAVYYGTYLSFMVGDRILGEDIKLTREKHKVLMPKDADGYRLMSTYGNTYATSVVTDE